MYSKYYINPKGEIAYDARFYGWNKEIVVDTVTTTPVPPFALNRQSPEAIIIKDEGYTARIDLINS